MNVSKTGKPLCCQCRKLATHTGNYHRSNGEPKHLYYCATHAPYARDSKPLDEQTTPREAIETPGPQPLPARYSYAIRSLASGKQYGRVIASTYQEACSVAVLQLPELWETPATDIDAINCGKVEPTPEKLSDVAGYDFKRSLEIAKTVHAVPKFCFVNAVKALRTRSLKLHTARYVEGHIQFLGMWIDHGWLECEDGTILDPTRAWIAEYGHKYFTDGLVKETTAEQDATIERLYIPLRRYTQEELKGVRLNQLPIAMIELTQQQMNLVLTRNSHEYEQTKTS